MVMAAVRTRASVWSRGGLSLRGDSWTVIIDPEKQGADQPAGSASPGLRAVHTANFPALLLGLRTRFWSPHTRRASCRAGVCRSSRHRADRPVPSQRPGHGRWASALRDRPVSNRLSGRVAAREARGGIVMDVASGEVMVGGLSMPHSPRWHAGRLWVCESGAGTLGFVDPRSGRYEAIAATPGFTRGLDFAGTLAFVGLSQVRETASSAASPSPSGSGPKCGPAVSAWSTWHEASPWRSCGSRKACMRCSPSSFCPDLQYPELVNDDAKLLENSFVVPDAALADVPAALRACSDQAAATTVHRESPGREDRKGINDHLTSRT